jgi:NADPH:quinone reductase-like Zn-dependent oxidoreductase
MELVKSLGADKVLDYTTTDFTKTVDKYDIIFDTVGKSSFANCKKVLENKGKYLVTVMSIKHVLLSLLTKFGNRKKVIFAMSVNKTEALNFIGKLVEEGKLKTVIDRQYPFEQIGEAHAYVEKGHKVGGVVINAS